VRYAPFDNGFTVANAMTRNGIVVEPPTKDCPYTAVTVTILTVGELTIDASKP
jgi:hypothetical protein